MGEEQGRLEARLHEALVTDSRVGEPELAVVVRGSRVVVDGSVPTEERRRAVSEVLAEVAPGLEIDNRVTTTPHREPRGEEAL
jgi:osmotically-inducible protein OsmY